MAVCYRFIPALPPWLREEPQARFEDYRQEVKRDGKEQEGVESHHQREILAQPTKDHPGDIRTEIDVGLVTITKGGRENHSCEKDRHEDRGAGDEHLGWPWQRK